MQTPAKRLRPIAFFGALYLIAGAALAQNTTAGTAARLTVGQPPVAFSLANNASQSWYEFTLRAGRSYCASLTTWDQELNQTDSVVDVFQSNGTTVIAHNDDIVTEPDAPLQSRACFISPVSTAFVRATQLTNAPRVYQMRLVETTLFCPWFFIAGDYNAFSLIRNTTDSTVSVTVNWRNGAGAIVGTTSTSIPGNGNLALNANSFVNNATTSTGSIEIAHNGSEDALKAGTTTLSPTTGIGFDSLFEQRRPW